MPVARRLAVLSWHLATVFILASIVMMQASAQVSVNFNGSGLSSLIYNNTQLLSYGDVRLKEVKFQNADGSIYSGATNSTVSVDPAAMTQTHGYSWGSIVTGYSVSGNRLNLTITVHNQASATIHSLWVNPLGLHLPAAAQEYDGNTPLIQSTTGGPALETLSYGSGVVLLAVDDVASPLLAGFPWALNRPTNTIFPLDLNTGLVSMYPNSSPNIVRPIPPGASDQYRISLRFGPPGSTKLSLAGDIYQAFGQAYPPTLSWPDRRPIGQLILGTAATGWATNPRGWLLDSSIDVNTPGGVASLKSRILAWAHNSVSILQGMNAQGMVTWDIEGEKFPHSTTYVCDPRQFEQLAPEMAGIADEYFQIFRDAGLRVGVCIRPQNFVVSPDGSTASQNVVSDPAQVTQLLIDKMNYARTRWGATLFYMDSNVNSNTDPNPIDPSIIKALQAAFPDSLVIPEHSSTRYFAYSAPYRQLNQGFTSTPADVRAIYPASFTVLYTPNGPIQQDFNTLVTSVQRGDALMVRGWYDDEPDHGTVNSIYQAAGSAVQVNVNPQTWTITAGQTHQFTAGVTGTANQQVSWSVTPPLGSISQSGLYSAPPSISSPQIVTVMATSAADPTKSGSASITINPPAPATIGASGGTPQTTAVNSVFGVALQALVNDASGNPVNGATVTFTAPASGPGAKFGAAITATSVTNSSGVATAPSLTANSQSGSYAVTAAVAGVMGQASFSLTNRSALPASIAASGGTPQTSPVNAAFAALLQATVRDAGNNPVDGITVSFTAPASGPSGAFGGSLSTTAVTNSSGVATAPALTANGQTGSYSVTATVSGVSSAAKFALSNNPAVPGTLTAAGGTLQSATVNTAFATRLQAAVRDTNNNPLNGIVVNFTAPASGASGTFGGLLSATAVTNSSGIATAFALTANAQAGSYTVTANVSGLAGMAAFNLTNDSLLTNGLLSGASDSNTTPVNLTAEGPRDWVHWGDTVLIRKAGVAPQIGSYKAVGGIGATPYANDPRYSSWSDGTPTVSSSNNSKGLYIGGIQNGFTFSVPADTNTHTLVVHVGGWKSGGKFTAYLSDASAPNFSDTTTVVGSQYDRNYTLIYRAGSPAQTLTVSWVMSSGTGNVTLVGAALGGSSLAAVGGTPQSAAVNSTFQTPIRAKVTDANGNPRSAVTVNFTAPSSGPSALFANSITGSSVTDSGGVATAPALTANSQTGTFILTARVAGLDSEADFSLTNSALLTTGLIAGSSDNVTTPVNLTLLGSADWVHWGDASATRKAGVRPQISNYNVVGTVAPTVFQNDPRSSNWVDGTPLATATGNTNGLFVGGLQNGFSFTVPADTAARTLTVNVGGWSSGGTLTARLSDESAPVFVDTRPVVNGQYDRNYTFVYSAAGPGQILTVTWIVNSGSGNVTFDGAALSVGP